MLVPRLARLSLLLLGLSASTDARMVTTVKRAAATNSSASAAAPANLNSSLSAVCTPTQCLQGANSLAAGTTIYTPVNSSSRATVLLPGTYTSSSSTTANSSLLTFGTSSTSFTAAGFSTTGTVGSTLSVSLLAGVTTYTGPLFQDTPTYTPLSASSASTNSTGSIESFLLSDNIWAVLTVGGSSGSRVVAWDGVADVGNLPGGSGGVVLEGFQSSTYACATGLFGKTCEACPAGCTDCDDGITGTGMCLTTNTTTTAAVCNCANGVCASNSTTATCSCNAGWATASNGTQCAACASGYYMSSGGDCLACDPSCESCSSPSGTCLTCQSGLQPDSTDGTKCTTATTALTNGTFITCPSRTFFDSTNKTCEPEWSVEWENGSTTAVGSNAVWVFDNSKGECDALPAKCTAGAIDNFTSASTTTLKQGTCVSAGCTVVDGFGVCLSSLVTVAAQSVAEETKKKTTIPWWLILVIILGALALLAIGVYFWRKKEQKRRRLQTARFANDLGKKEVDLKLKELPHNIAYPPLPRAEPDEEDVPLTPRFVIEDNRLAPSPKSSRWSISSYGSNAKSLKPQNTGVSAFSGASGYSGKSFTSANGKKIVLGDRNPFRK
ncbi:hypothetical protein MNV49_003841 [Pseudohyphozyma bogoriensis]|nr:hypothetical protein MNV49_003841 [Pseudohyphozyma bogoriensis]